MFQITVKHDNGEQFTITATSRDVAAWERGGKGRALGQLAQNPRLTDLYALAHAAAVRQGRYTGGLEAFEMAVDIEVDAAPSDEDGVAGVGGPTLPDRLGG